LFLNRKTYIFLFRLEGKKDYFKKRCPETK
jgi:hypothetical protein